MDKAKSSDSKRPENGDEEMTINLQKPDIRELKPKITVFGVGGGGGNAVNNMINGGLQGCEFVVANTDSQALMMSKAERVIQLGIDVTQGLGAGSQPDVGRAAAEECIDEIVDHLQGTHMAFVTAGMGGGTGTGAAPVVARAAREQGILTVGVVTKPFHFEGGRRMETAEAGISELQKNVDTLIVIPNQNLFRIANDKTTFADAFGMADQVLYSGVACITDLMVKEGLINLDFADVRSVMREMGKAMMGTGEASGDGRSIQAAEAAIANPLLDETSMRGAQGLLISITGGRDLTLFEVDEAATRIREEVDGDANIILGATFDESLEGVIRVSVVATGIDRTQQTSAGLLNERPVAAIARPQAAAKAEPTSEPAQEPSGEPVRQSFATPSLNAGRPAAKPAAAIVQPTAARQEQPTQAAPAAARIERNGIGIEPFKPGDGFDNPEMEAEFKKALEADLMPENDAFIPPSPQKPESGAPVARMPQVEDFPPIVQAAIEQSGAPSVEDHHDERGPMGLLKKLTHGFGAREEGTQRPQETARVEAPRAPDVTQIHAERHADPRPSDDVRQASQDSRVDDNPYAPRRGGLDDNGRINPNERPASEDDQLDIPAFLRRQSS